MMHKTKAGFMLLLLFSLPFYASLGLAQTLNASNTTVNVTVYVRNPAKACVEKAERTSQLADVLDNEIIGFLETIASIMFLISTIMNSIDVILATLGNIIGFFEGNCCRLQGPPAAACSAMD